MAPDDPLAMPAEARFLYGLATVLLAGVGIVAGAGLAKPFHATAFALAVGAGTALLGRTRRRAWLATYACGAVIVAAATLDELLGDLGHELATSGITAAWNWPMLALAAVIGTIAAGLVAVTCAGRVPRTQALLSMASAAYLGVALVIAAQYVGDPGLRFIVATVAVLTVLTVVVIVAPPPVRLDAILVPAGSFAALSIMGVDRLSRDADAWRLSGGWLNAYELDLLLLGVGVLLAVAISIDAARRSDVDRNTAFDGAATAAIVSIVGSVVLWLLTDGLELAALVQCWIGAGALGAAVVVAVGSQDRRGLVGALPAAQASTFVLPAALWAEMAGSGWLVLGLAAWAIVIALVSVVAVAHVRDLVPPTMLPLVPRPVWLGLIAVALPTMMSLALPSERTLYAEPIAVTAKQLDKATVTIDRWTCLRATGGEVVMALVTLDPGRWPSAARIVAPAHHAGPVSWARLQPCLGADPTLDVPGGPRWLTVAVPTRTGAVEARVRATSLSVRAWLTVVRDGQSQRVAVVGLDGGRFGLIAPAPPTVYAQPGKHSLGRVGRNTRMERRSGTTKCCFRVSVRLRDSKVVGYVRKDAVKRVK